MGHAETGKGAKVLEFLVCFFGIGAASAVLMMGLGIILKIKGDK